MTRRGKKRKGDHTRLILTLGFAIALLVAFFAFAG